MNFESFDLVNVGFMAAKTSDGLSMKKHSSIMTHYAV